jgi:hypothetical protein
MPSDEQRNYEIGYGRPPRHTRFQRGRSGNPSGRPKGAQNLATLLSEALNETVTVAENGRRRKISKRRAIVTQLVNRSAQADLKATQILLAVIQDIERRSEITSAEAGPRRNCSITPVCRLPGVNSTKPSASPDRRHHSIGRTSPYAGRRFCRSPPARPNRGNTRLGS